MDWLALAKRRIRKRLVLSLVAFLLVRRIRDKQGALAKLLPTQWHFSIRNSAFVRWLADFLVMVAGGAALVVTSPRRALLHFRPRRRVALSLQYTPHGGDGGEAQQTACLLDVFAPAPGDRQGAGGDASVLFVHGGVWSLGNKQQYVLLGERLAEAGLVCGVAGYSTWPRGTAERQANEVAQLVRYWQTEAGPRFGADPGKVYVFGHSR